VTRGAADRAALIVGCGDIGLRVAHALIDSGTRVTALVRSDASRAALQAQGLDARAVDLDDASCAPLPAAPEVFWFAPPSARCAPSGPSARQIGRASCRERVS
jgi:nucleoside-diphosphate-sugar epimerase